MDDLNIWWQVRENNNQVTEEAIRRIQENQKKAQQIGQEIKKDKSTNDKIAKFLSFLLEDIKNDELVKQIYHTFFDTTQETTETTHNKKNINTLLTVGVFVPFYQEKTKELELDSLYKEIVNHDEPMYLTNYIAYIKKILATYDNTNITNKPAFTKLIKNIAEHYQLIEKLTTEEEIEFDNTIKKELAIEK